MVRFIPGEAREPLAIALGATKFQAWDIVKKKQLIDYNAQADINDLSFQPLNEFCVFST